MAAVTIAMRSLIFLSSSEGICRSLIESSITENGEWRIENLRIELGLVSQVETLWQARLGWWQQPQARRRQHHRAHSCHVTQAQAGLGLGWSLAARATRFATASRPRSRLKCEVGPPQTILGRTLPTGPIEDTRRGERGQSQHEHPGRILLNFPMREPRAVPFVSCDLVHEQLRSWNRVEVAGWTSLRHDWVAFRLLAGKHGNGLAKLVLSDLRSFSNRAAWVGGAGHVGSRPLF